MSSKDDAPDHLLVIQLNADLRSAQLDLLSAQCATDRLRLRFSTEDLARFGHRETVHKAASSATALHEFYSTIERAVRSVDSTAPGNHPAEEPTR